MTSVSVSRIVAAPIERVWDVFTDIPAATDRVPSIKAIEVLSDVPFGPGFRWRETRRMFGMDATEEMWVSEIGEHAFYEVAADSRGTAYLSRYDFTEVPGGTRVDLTFSGQPHDLITRIIDATTGWLLAGTARKQLRKDLHDLAAVCEG